MLDAYELERLGVPTITVCHDRFEAAARLHAKTLGMPDLPLLVEPVPRGGSITHDLDALSSLVETRVVEVEAALAAEAGRVELRAAPTPPLRPEVV